MTALTKNMSRPCKAPPGGLQFRSLPLIGYTANAGGNVAHTVYKGAPVFCDISDGDGYYRAIITNDADADDIVGGIAIEKQYVGSSITANGQKNVTVAINGVWAFPKGSIAITDIGAPIYMADDAVAQTSSTTALWIGFLVEWDSTYAWVDIEPACGHINAVPAA